MLFKSLRAIPVPLSLTSTDALQISTSTVMQVDPASREFKTSSSTHWEMFVKATPDLSSETISLPKCWIMPFILPYIYYQRIRHQERSYEQLSNVKPPSKWWVKSVKRVWYFKRRKHTPYLTFPASSQSSAATCRFKMAEEWWEEPKEILIRNIRNSNASRSLILGDDVVPCLF